jgi:class 3 adenylate cyclase/tetratricopeptide (TPR) repeat protein
MQQRRLAAIMFTDIVGYTALMGKDEEQAFKLLRKNRKIQQPLIEHYNGTLLKEIGDGILASFSSSSDAVRCSIKIQTACKEENIRLRIGIHEGEVVFEGGDVLGDGVNIASRLQEATDPGCISISGAVYNNVKNKPEIEAEFVKETTFKNIEEPIKVYKVSCEERPVKESTTEDLGSSFDHRKLIIDKTIIEESHEDIKKTESIKAANEQEPHSVPVKRRLKVSNVFIGVLIIVVAILAYSKIFEKDKFEEIRDPDGKISIAVMPFENLSGDTLYNVWQGGFQNLLITTLSNSEELSVRQYQAMYSILEGKRRSTHASITPSVARELALKLETRTFILGNILKAGNKIRVNAQLVNAETEEIYKTYQVDGNTEDDIFAMADSLSGLIKNYLEIKKLIEQYDSPAIRGSFNTNSSEAFEYYIHGWDAFMDLAFQPATEWLSKAVETDSGFINPYVTLSFTYCRMGNDELSKKWCNMANKKRHELPLKGKLMLDHLNAYYFETPDEEIKYIKQFLEIDEMNTTYWFLLGLAYYQKYQDYKNAIISCEKALEIHEKWGTNYRNPWIYAVLGVSYHKVNEHKREKEVYELGLSIFPENTRIIQLQAICALSQGNTDSADDFITKYKSIKKNKSLWPESRILSGVGYIFTEVNLFDEAESSYRQAFKLDPRNPSRMHDLAWFLIDNDINVNEGLELVQKALELRPDNWYYLDTKGWGLYKQGRHEEALKVLKDSWNLRPYYKHEGYQHIQEVEQALASQNE